MEIELPEHIIKRKMISKRRSINLYPSYGCKLTVGDLMDQLIDLPSDSVVEQERVYYEGDSVEHYVEWSEVESDEDYDKRIEKYKKYMTTKLQNTK